MTDFFKKLDVQGALRLRLVAQGYAKPDTPLGVPASLPLRLLAYRYNLHIMDPGIIRQGVLAKNHYTSIDIDYYNWIGCDYPFFVLVGEKSSSRAPSPWYPFIGGLSSQYLWNALSPISLSVFNSLAVTNAMGEELLFNKIEAAARVVALGSKAGKVLSDHKIEHETVGHPSWARRWGRIPVERYREMLFEALGIASPK